MICDPRARRSRSIENCEENKDLFRDGIQFYSSVREGPMIRDSSSQSAESDGEQGCEEYVPTRQWEKHDADPSDDMNQNQVSQYGATLSINFPPGLCPGVLLDQRRAMCQ